MERESFMRFPFPTAGGQEGGTEGLTSGCCLTFHPPTSPTACRSRRRVYAGSRPWPLCFHRVFPSDRCCYATVPHTLPGDALTPGLAVSDSTWKRKSDAKRVCFRWKKKEARRRGQRQSDGALKGKRLQRRGGIIKNPNDGVLKNQACSLFWA